MKILFIGDIVGKPGRRMMAAHLPALLQERGVDFSVANVENAAGGFGITPAVADELFDLGLHAFTSGNHVWDQREGLSLIASDPRSLRPANYPPDVPGRGLRVFQTSNGTPVGVLNLLGRVFLPALDCPFRVGAEAVARLRAETPIILVDIHAEATSEKISLAWHLDGKVSAVIGTHTHVQTADEWILPGGTAFLSDAGMTGPSHSVIGVKRQGAIKRFLTGLPQKFETATGPAQLNGVLVTVDPKTGKAEAIERIQIRETEGEAKSDPGGGT